MRQYALERGRGLDRTDDHFVTFLRVFNPLENEDGFQRSGVGTR
jgi:hypothetical protein